MDARRYLYIFGYETPMQRENNAAHGWDDEDSAAIFIVAETEQQALEWGHAISKKFVDDLSSGQSAIWDENRFAAWVDHDYAKNFSARQLRAIPIVRYGEYPDVGAMLPSSYGKATITATGSSA